MRVPLTMQGQDYNLLYRILRDAWIQESRAGNTYRATIIQGWLQEASSRYAEKALQ